MRAAINLAMWIFGLGTLVVGVGAVLQRDIAWLIPAGVLTLLFAMTWLVHAVEEGRHRCAACESTLFGSHKGPRHPQARTILGSRDLRVSIDILAKGQYRCPSCNQQVTSATGRKVRSVKGFTTPRTPGQS